MFQIYFSRKWINIFITGATAGDEMCNLYLMYYTDAGHAKFQTCMNEISSKVIANLPADSDTPVSDDPPTTEGESVKNRRKGDAL